MSEKMNEIIERISKIEHGFVGILKEAEDYKNDHSAEECLRVSQELFASEIYQVRSLATFILGFIAANSIEAFRFLKETISRDEDWRVQEILAKSFDRFCSDRGYENALPEIKEWLSDENSNVRRAVTEGLRIWTGRDYFKDHPDVAINLLSALRDDESEYVRKSVGNALKDISKKHKELVSSEIKSWNVSNDRIKQTYKFASKWID